MVSVKQYNTITQDYFEKLHLKITSLTTAVMFRDVEKLLPIWRTKSLKRRFNCLIISRLVQFGKRLNTAGTVVEARLLRSYLFNTYSPIFWGKKRDVVSFYFSEKFTFTSELSNFPGNTVTLGIQGAICLSVPIHEKSSATSKVASWTKGGETGN